MKKMKFKIKKIKLFATIYLLVVAFFGIMQLQLYGHTKRIKALIKPRPQVIQVVDQYNFTNEIKNLKFKILALRKLILQHKRTIHYGH